MNMRSNKQFKTKIEDKGKSNTKKLKLMQVNIIF